MSRPALRTLLLVPLLATLVGGSVALGLYVYRAVEADLIQAVDDELARALLSSEFQLARPGPSAPPAPTRSDGLAPVQVVFDADGRLAGVGELDDPVLAEALAEQIGEPGVATVAGAVAYRAAVVPTRSGDHLAVALSLEPVEQSLASLRRNLLVGGLVLVLAQVGVAIAVSGAIARPVSRLRDAAHRVATGDLDADLGQPSGSRETAALTEDLGVMLDRLRATIAQRGQAAADAERARHDMERFMADAAHELRTPLTALRGYSDLHGAGMLDEAKTAEAMGRIGAESQRLTVLVRDLLELVRPPEPMVSRVDLAAVASAAVHDLRAAHPEFLIGLHLDDQGACGVIGDAARLHQAVLNLGVNAWFHTPPGTPTTVTVTGDRGQVRLAVADAGPGVDPSVRAELFRPFARGDASRSRRSHDGAGLGLALVRRIAEQHGGEVAASETPGGGATFTLVLPAASPEPI